MRYLTYLLIILIIGAMLLLLAFNSPMNGATVLKQLQYIESN